MSRELPYRDRPMHVYMPGKTRYGKSTLMFWMALDDIKNDQGVTVLDAKGDLIPKLLKAVPKRRRDDAIYLDIEAPVPIDFMSAKGDRARERLVSDLKFLITKGIGIEHAYTVNTNLTNVIYTLLNFNDNKDIKPERKACFLDIYWFLENETRREEIKQGLTDPEFIKLWKQPLPRPNFTAQDMNRITARMNDWVRSKSLQAIFGAPSPSLRIEDCYDQQKILLVKLGYDEIQSIYGTLVVSKLREAAMRQSPLPEPDRIPHFLYCDEFQHFQTSDFATIIAEAGGLGLCLTLAHQYIGQLDEKIRDAITEMISTFFIFRVGQKTANALRGEIPSMETKKVWRRSSLSGEMVWQDEPMPFDPERLTKLQKFEVLHRRADGTASFEKIKKWPLFESDGYAEYIKKRTLEKYHCEPLVLTNMEDSTPPTTDGDLSQRAPNVSPHRRKEKEPRTPR